MKQLLPLFLLLVGCSTPFVAKADFAGDGLAAFDGSNFGSASDGSFYVELRVKGSAVPVYAYGAEDAVLFVADLEEDWNESYAPGEPISAEARAVLAGLYTAEELTEIAAMGFILTPQP